MEGVGGKGQDNFNPQIVHRGHWEGVTSRDKGVFPQIRDSSVLVPLTCDN